ncbi:SMC-Scp complex subunit ScpB [Amycolatopsis sp. NPDC048633]|uniref:SMC-Scp complex subunit ScpB n=1 Tax=Amycolatopsis sp. NPDC048633 TaxID=3157095 RepID=UPI0034043CC2
MGEPGEGAAELALDEALSGEPVTEDGSPVEPLVEEAAAEVAPADETPVEEAAAEVAPAEETPVEEAAAEVAPADETPVEEAASEEPAEAAAELEVDGAAAAEPDEAAAEATPEPAPAEDAAVSADLDPADPASDLVAAGDIDSLPDVTPDETLEAALEALLLVVDSPASEESLAETVGQPKARILVALRTMAQKFTDRASGIDLRRVGEGWRFYTRDVYAPFVEKLLLDGQRSKLTRAALESLAVIAYRQPVTRSRVAAVRGVNVDGVIRTLLARGLIAEMGTDPETTGTLYVTTELFLERLGLSSLNDLPAIAPLLPEVDTIDDFQ